MEKDFSKQVADGERFEFGVNWKVFLKTMTDERISVAEDSLEKMLSGRPSTGQTFLDIGCGSGLFSLAARRLGYNVHSFDFDSQSVACTISLKEKYFPECSGERIFNFARRWIAGRSARKCHATADLAVERANV